MLNAGISVINPLSYVPYVPSVAVAPFNTMLANGLSQYAANGNVNLTTVGISGLMRFGFGVATGGYSPDSLGSAWASGMSNGLFSSAARATGGW
jgi:hypothetical protein